MSAGESDPGTVSFVVRLLLAVVLIVAVFLLGRDMVGHRFFQGGWVSQRDVLRQ
jgi:hypothetical protein